MSDYISVLEAQSRILKALHPTGYEFVPLILSAGRILAQDITAPDDMPSFTNASMDGFAVIASDVAGASTTSPVRLKVVSDIPAGTGEVSPIDFGEAAQIMTGAMVPPGADAVVPIEDTNGYIGYTNKQSSPLMDREVLIYHPAQVGANIRFRGDDYHQGQVLLTKGRKLQPQDIGMIASIGMDQVQVHRKPVIALFSSGDEVVQPGERLKPGQIYDSNQYLLATMIEDGGGSILRLGTALDKPNEIHKLLVKAVDSGADMIVTSAGVSAGAYDYVRQVIETNGELNFWKVNMRPGKPLAFGSFANTPVIGLPGNPVSTFVGCRIFVLPAVSQLAGCPPSAPRLAKAIVKDEVISDGRESYLRAFVQEENGVLTARLTGHQGSGNLFSLVQANALLIVPSGVKSLPLDSEADVWFLNTKE